MFLTELVVFNAKCHYPLLTSERFLLKRTLPPRDRYLMEHFGDGEKALQTEHERAYTFGSSLQRMVIGALPFVGPASSLVWPLFVQLREVALVAALRGYDVEDDDIKSRIILVIVYGEVGHLPKVAVTKVGLGVRGSAGYVEQHT